MGQPSRHPDPAVSLAELRIAGDDGQFLPPGQVGELVVRTPIVMQGYFRDEAQTRAAFRDGWFLTGDLAYVDEDNFFWFVARKKDIIRKRGENISGAELDRVIGNHPSVLEAAAIPVPSEFGEDEILVAVVLRPGMTLAHEEIAQWCRERLAAIKVPRYVALVDALPHTPTHRVAKFKLREDASLRAQAVDLQAVTS
jgi:crotonobetaine/carnitine-CoA ligase